MSHLSALISACVPRVTTLNQAYFNDAIAMCDPETIDTPLKPVHDMTNLTRNVLVMPFDAVRASYARAVRAGLIQRSMLASARFERHLNAVEDLALGPLARHY